MRPGAFFRLIAVALVGASFAAPVAAQVSAARIGDHVRILASDGYHGRGPTQAGEEATIRYLARQFAAAGLQPGGSGGSWYQEVPLVRYDRISTPRLVLNVGGAEVALRLGQDVTASSRFVGETRLDGAPLVFVGYGINDPLLGWNSFEGVDLRGKVAVFLANDPDFEAARPGLFGGRALVLAGRFGSKVEAARRAGAVAVLVIHEEAAASYPWSQVQNGDVLPGFGLRPADPSQSGFGLTGWLHRDAALNLFRRAGLDFERLRVAARQPSFRAMPIGGATLTAHLTTTATDVVSRNVVARLPGRTHPDETIIYGAHWDAIGVTPPDARGDTIRNGAVDNAVGTATLLEVARAFGRAPRPGRSILFIAYTAEEKGLLGSEYYAANPLAPLETTAAVLNLDPHVAMGAARTVDLIGGGRTDLEADLARVAARHDMRVEEERSPEAGWYFRSDHFPFARRGVPALAFRAGRDLVRGGRLAADRWIEAYNGERYHQTSDEILPGVQFGGPAQEGILAYEIGRALADSRRWPGWHPTAEYRALREASAAARR